MAGGASLGGKNPVSEFIAEIQRLVKDAAAKKKKSVSAWLHENYLNEDYPDWMPGSREGRMTERGLDKLAKALLASGIDEESEVKPFKVKWTFYWEEVKGDGRSRKDRGLLVKPRWQERLEELLSKHKTRKADLSDLDFASEFLAKSILGPYAQNRAGEGIDNAICLKTFLQTEGTKLAVSEDHLDDLLGYVVHYGTSLSFTMGDKDSYRKLSRIEELLAQSQTPALPHSYLISWMNTTDSSKKIGGIYPERDVFTFDDRSTSNRKIHGTDHFKRREIDGDWNVKLPGARLVLSLALGNELVIKKSSSPAFSRRDDVVVV